MSRTRLCGARILSADGWLDGHRLVLQGPAIAAIEPDTGAVEPDDVLLSGGLLVPGFLDVQVNGGGGVLFNDAPTVDGIAAIAAAHRRFGTTGLLPTLISDELEVIARAIAAVDAAIAKGVPGVLGIHIEGPFLNQAKRGVHDSSRFRTLDAAAIELLTSLRHGITMVTLAPELAPDGAIAALAGRGAVVMAGHSLADYRTIASARAEGLRGATHLFNAMTQMEGRNPGLVGAALDLQLYAGAILDGHHVHPASLRVAHRALGPGHMLLVTDAMPTVGWDQDRFTLGDTAIALQDGALRTPDGTLAGSHLDMAAAVRNAVAMLGVPLAEACAMASAVPAALLGTGQTRGTLAPGCAADIVHLGADHRVSATWIAGHPYTCSA